MENNVHNINSDRSHIFVGHDGFFGGPLESILHGISDFRHELDSFSGINQQVSSLIFGSKRPDFKSIIFFPTIFVLQVSGSFFLITFRSTVFTSFNIFSKTFSERFSLSIKSVMFIGGFSETNLVGCFGNSFFIGNNGVGFNDFNIGEFSFEIM